MATAENRRARSTRHNLGRPISGRCGQAISALYAAGEDGLTPDQLRAAVGWPSDGAMHGSLRYLRFSCGVAIESHGHRPGNAALPGRFYLVPFGSRPA